MHPLRFSNRDIITKRGGRAASHSQPLCRADHPWPGRGQGSQQRGGRLRPGPARKGGRRCSQGQQLTGAALAGTAAREHTHIQRDARKGLPPVASPTASRGDGTGNKGGRPFVGWLPAGNGSRRLRRGSSSSGADGARGVRAFF
ncbi:hypothetical protein BHM03_00043747 [Ensete ventricosum]|nr:hypothetical protein BHM03_00043747 [Ensete ventricosum]